MGGGAAITSEMRKGELVSILQRYRDRKLLRYHHCTDAELYKSIHDRGLKTYSLMERPRTKRKLCNRDRKPLVSVLEAADEELRFDKFLELPIELRCLVYEYYLAPCGRTIECSELPRLADASPLIRREFLPVFFTNLEVVTASRKIIWLQIMYSPRGVERQRADKRRQAREVIVID